MKNPFRFMSKGSWAVVGVILLCGAIVSVHSHQFQKGNVWQEDRMEDATPRELEMDMQEIHVADFVTRATGAAFSALLIAFVYIAVRLERIKRRIQEAEKRGKEPEASAAMEESSVQ